MVLQQRGPPQDIKSAAKKTIQGISLSVSFLTEARRL
jgi:hypothetical protein